MKKPRKSNIDAFISLPASEKERIIRELDAETPGQRLARSRALNQRERRQFRQFKAKIGRPKVGKGAKSISLTVERTLLKQADDYARQHGISRANLIAQGLKAILGSAAA